MSHSEIERVRKALNSANIDLFKVQEEFASFRLSSKEEMDELQARLEKTTARLQEQLGQNAALQDELLVQQDKIAEKECIWEEKYSGLKLHVERKMEEMAEANSWMLDAGLLEGFSPPTTPV
eukprot:TRINITY_DN5021_c0_g1_i4.p1 TRINITY_DN5021_c0_g1~~TRINITY_DN5021_c0_g1_i4.p1  ORF type:complete len:122 (-),score=46.58 TRINITY_DN5021_c0_g1_i4:631-996(-)